MEILQIVGLALIGAILAVILRQQKPELALMLSIGVGVLLFLAVIGQISAVFNTLRDLASRANISMVYIGTILKIVGVAYIADFGAQICRDSGEGALASKVEFAAKILVLVMAVPIVIAVLQALLKLVP